MNRLPAIFRHAANGVAGFLLIPVGVLGFLTATNSSKGWGVANPDGAWFIPLGILLLLACGGMIALQILSLSRRKRANLRRFTSPVAYGVGLAAYGLWWLASLL